MIELALEQGLERIHEKISGIDGFPKIISVYGWKGHGRTKLIREILGGLSKEDRERAAIASSKEDLEQISPHVEKLRFVFLRTEPGRPLDAQSLNHLGRRSHFSIRVINPNKTHEITADRIAGTANLANITIKHGFR
ncbi:hypothetical protein HY993_04480 [Candidatus Micrarchaeota archaeon]|nr:hypothetical protein [Candidatus Micrarchaeota archaeon]